MNKEEIEALIEMRNNCLNASVYDDEKRLLKSNAITRALMLEQENKQLKEEIKQHQTELEKADSIIQSCIFQGKDTSGISFRNCLNKMTDYKTRIDKAIYNLEKSIEIINKKLLKDKTTIEVKNGVIQNMNDYQIVRLKAIKMKCKEILKILEGDSNVVK